jgi:hypothetical protein
MIMDDNSSFMTAILDAHRELESLKIKEREIFIRKAQLQKTIYALFPLAFPDSQPTDVNSLTLPDAIRLVFGSSGRHLSAMGMRTKLEDIGYDLSKFDNPLANIHTAMNRMLESGELTKMSADEGKKTFAPGPELKEVPDVTNIPDDAVEKAMKALAADQVPTSGGDVSRTVEMINSITESGRKRV